VRSAAAACLAVRRPHGGSRTFHPKSTCPDAIDFEAKLGHVTSWNQAPKQISQSTEWYLGGADGEIVEREALRRRVWPRGDLRRVCLGVALPQRFLVCRDTLWTLFCWQQYDVTLIGVTSCTVKAFRSRRSFISSPLWTP